MQLCLEVANERWQPPEAAARLVRTSATLLFCLCYEAERGAAQTSLPDFRTGSEGNDLRILDKHTRPSIRLCLFFVCGVRYAILI